MGGRLPWLLLVFLASGMAVAQPETARPATGVAPPSAGVAKPQAAQPVIQIALLLDTSNSMDGLIEQAKQHLWSVVNQFAITRKDGVTPRLEVALFEYGNSGLPAEAGHIRLVQPLTADLDAVSEALASLRTNGGNEFCGQVISEAVRQLSWGADPKAYRAIFIAGNEPFTQGSVNYESACRNAISRGIIVNTIHCGDRQTGVATMWEHGAQLADGTYLHIDQNQRLVHIPAPQDDEIARLNTELNATYVWYGAAGAAARERQEAQDRYAATAAPAVAAERTAAKSSSLYSLSEADLVDAMRQEPEAIANLPADQLPENMREMTVEERKAYVEEQAARRAEIQKQIATLSAERERHVAAERAKLAASGEDTLGDAMLKAVRRQVAAKGYEVE